MTQLRLRSPTDAPSTEWPFKISETEVLTDTAAHPMLVITPRAPMMFGVERIETLRKPTRLSAADRYLIEQTRHRKGRVHLAALRAGDGFGQRLWSFDPILTAGEVEELGYLITKSLIPVHRRMMANGVALLAHTEWGPRECYAMRYGVRRLLAELSDQPHSNPALTDVDTWILRNMLFHFALDLEHVKTTLLPNQIRMIERRWERVSALITRLPEHVLE